VAADQAAASGEAAAAAAEMAAKLETAAAVRCRESRQRLTRSE